MLSIVLHDPAKREKLPGPGQPVIAVTLRHDEHFETGYPAGSSDDNRIRLNRWRAFKDTVKVTCRACKLC
jgi:hypothetical protein